MPALVFAAELDRARYPVRSRAWGIVIGTLLLGFVVAGMVSPRTIAFTIPILALGMLVSSWTRDDLENVLQLNAPGWAPFTAIAGYALLSTLWSAKPLTTVDAPLWLVFYLAISLLVMKLVRREPRRNAFHLAEGLWLGMFVGLGYLLVEVLSNQALKIFIYNTLHVPKSWLRPATIFEWQGDRLVSILPMDLTRSIVPVTLLMWSALLTLRTTAPWQAVKFWSLAFYVLAVAVIIFSDHETSKAAIIISTIVFLLARWRSEWARLLLQTGVVIACFGVVPVSLALHRFGLHTVPWIQEILPASCRHVELLGRKRRDPAHTWTWCGHDV